MMDKLNAVNANMTKVIGKFKNQAFDEAF